MKIEFDDSEMRKLTRDLEKKAKAISGEVSFSELFSSEFMVKNTKFSDLDSFFAACGIHTSDDFKAFPGADLDVFVRDNSQFASWEDMQVKAGKDYAVRKFKGK